MPLKLEREREREKRKREREIVQNVFSRIHLKPINVRWIRTGCHPYEKTNMSNIVLHPVFYEYKNVQSQDLSPCFRHLGF